MQNTYRLYRRDNDIYYAEHTVTRKQHSLRTKDKAEAERQLAGKNQAAEQPALNLAMAKVYLAGKSPEFCSRIWADVAGQMESEYDGPTLKRFRRFKRSAPLSHILTLPLVYTDGDHFSLVLKHPQAGASTKHWLRVMHNRAVDLGWILAPVLSKRGWKAIKFEARRHRALTEEEHGRILAHEKLEDYRLFFQMLWEVGGAQSDVAALRREDFDDERSLLTFIRKKLSNRDAGHVALVAGPRLKALLQELPQNGPLFPRLGSSTANVRASHFAKLCKRAKVEEVSLHSYRYSWAQRARKAGMPEREAMSHLGHASKAIHRYYSKGADIVTQSLEHYEARKAEEMAGKVIPFVQDAQPPKESAQSSLG